MRPQPPHPRDGQRGIVQRRNIARQRLCIQAVYGRAADHIIGTDHVRERSAALRDFVNHFILSRQEFAQDAIEFRGMLVRVENFAALRAHHSNGSRGVSLQPCQRKLPRRATRILIAVNRIDRECGA